ncbi:MAG: hypothetical protein VYA34_01165 [Myxococcota bacterium]|nr:hypothetical protein [Myxococcota bacterium]
MQKAPVLLSASVDKARASTGDVITYSIDVDYKADIKLEFPDIGADIQGLRILDTQKLGPTSSKNRFHQHLEYKLRGDLVGSYILPALKLSYKDPDSGDIATIESSNIFIEIESVLPSDGSAKDIRGLKPIRKVSATPSWALPIIVLGCFTLLGFVIYWTRYKKRAITATPPLPPHEIAFRALNSLRATDFDHPSAVKDYFFSLSEILRGFVEARFSINATDLTTEELLPKLQHLSIVEPQNIELLSRFAQESDGFKYADRIPDKVAIETNYERVLRFIESTQITPAQEGES